MNYIRLFYNNSPHYKHYIQLARPINSIGTEYIHMDIWWIYDLFNSLYSTTENLQIYPGSIMNDMLSPLYPGIALNNDFTIKRDFKTNNWYLYMNDQTFYEHYSQFFTEISPNPQLI